MNLTPGQGVAGGVFSWAQSDREVVLGPGFAVERAGIARSADDAGGERFAELQRAAGGGFSDCSGGDRADEVGGRSGVHFGVSLSVKSGRGLVGC